MSYQILYEDPSIDQNIAVKTLYQSESNDETSRTKFNNEVQKCIDTIESKITWENLLNIQKIMNNYIKLVEKDETNLSSMMNEFIYTYNHLSNNESQVSQCLAECLFERFFNDFPLKLPAFAYILTREGLIYVFSAPEDD